MKRSLCVGVVILFFCLGTSAFAGKGYMGGSGTLTTSGAGSGGGEVSSGTTEEVPPTDGPLNDKMSEAGKLFGDLYVIARYKGGETKRVPAVKDNGEPVMEEVEWLDENGQPVICLTGQTCMVEQQQWGDPATAVGGEPKLSESFATYTIVNEDTGEYEINPDTGDIYFPAPYPSQCVQPVADVERWGDISSKTGLDENRLPLVITYDPTWERTECAVKNELFLAAGEKWNGVTYNTAIYYPDLIQEVDFGRLNLGRSPDSVLDHAFDEAIRSLNRAKRIVLDASGRLLLTTEVYDEYLTDEDGEPVLLETVTKAIDSPLENLALYIKLMNDGHLITPADERTAIDRSLYGGIPLSKLVEIEDGPSKVLRPTIDIEKMKAMGLGNLVDAANITPYYTSTNELGELVVTAGPSPADCADCVTSYGILSQSEDDVCTGPDFSFAATFFASAADKSGKINMDKVVYLNSILGINKVVGYSAYENGDPVAGAIDYSKNPDYFNFAGKMPDFADKMPVYSREGTFTNRGQVVIEPGGGNPATYDGEVRVLVESSSGTWVETENDIFSTVFSSQENGGDKSVDISGFTTMADDDLRTINYIHTYQIPGLR